MYPSCCNATPATRVAGDKSCLEEHSLEAIITANDNIEWHQQFAQAFDSKLSEESSVACA